MGGSTATTSPEIPDELKGLYVDAVKYMRQGMVDMPMSDFYEMPERQFSGLSGSEERAMAASENLYGQSPALNEAFNLASLLGGNAGTWQGADLSRIGQPQAQPRDEGPPQAPPGYPGRR